MEDNAICWQTSKPIDNVSTEVVEMSDSWDQQ